MRPVDLDLQPRLSRVAFDREDGRQGLQRRLSPRREPRHVRVTLERLVEPPQRDAGVTRIVDHHRRKEIDLREVRRLRAVPDLPRHPMPARLDRAASRQGLQLPVDERLVALRPAVRPAREGQLPPGEPKRPEPLLGVRRGTLLDTPPWCFETAPATGWNGSRASNPARTTWSPANAGAVKRRTARAMRTGVSGNRLPRVPGSNSPLRRPPEPVGRCPFTNGSLQAPGGAQIKRRGGRPPSISTRGGDRGGPRWRPRPPHVRDWTMRI